MVTHCTSIKINNSEVTFQIITTDNLNIVQIQSFPCSISILFLPHNINWGEEYLLVVLIFFSKLSHSRPPASWVRAGKSYHAVCCKEMPFTFLKCIRMPSRPESLDNLSFPNLKTSQNLWFWPWKPLNSAHKSLRRGCCTSQLTIVEVRYKFWKLLFSLTIFSRCHDDQVIPKFFKVELHVYTFPSHKFLHRGSLSFSRKYIHTRRNLDFVFRYLLKLHFHIAHILVTFIILLLIGFGIVKLNYHVKISSTISMP